MMAVAPESSNRSPVASAAELLVALSSAGLLRHDQLSEVGPLAERGADLKEMTRELSRRGWLTRFQLTMALHGRADELTLGRYRLLERLGAGAMGEVYKAVQVRLGQVVALKVLRSELLTNAVIRRRFLREARAAGRLNHPHIVRVFDAECDGDVHYLVMEYVDGLDLSRRVKESGPLPIERACAYARQVALGLHHAHERGLVHRDVKPSNILVDGRGDAKLLDMGLARPVGDDWSRSLADPLTRAGAVLGTPDYMAPEQARDSRAVDARADLYSLGASLVFLLTGRSLFPGGTPVEKLLKQQVEPAPALRALRPDAPPALEPVLAKLLAKRPEQRYASAAEVATALAPFAAGTPAEPPLPATAESSPSTFGEPLEVTLPTVALHGRRPARRGRPVLAAVAGGVGIALLIALAVTAWYLWFRPDH